MVLAILHAVDIIADICQQLTSKKLQLNEIGATRVTSPSLSFSVLWSMT